MRTRTARRVGVERVDGPARADYRRARERWNKMLFQPPPEQRWCCKCGWCIKPGEAYRQRDPKRRVPGRDGEKSNFTCQFCPWASPLDAHGVLNGLSPEVLNVAQLWATHLDQQCVSLTGAWQITSAHDGLDSRDWWSSIECLVAQGVLRIPAKTDTCAMPFVYVDILARL